MRLSQVEFNALHCEPFLASLILQDAFTSTVLAQMTTDGVATLTSIFRPAAPLT